MAEKEKGSQGSKRSKSEEDMEEEPTSNSNKTSRIDSSNSSSPIDVDKANNNRELDEDEDFIDLEAFKKEDIKGVLLVFEALPFMTNVDSISATITRLGFHIATLPSINDFTHTAYVRIEGEDSVYDDFKAKYKGEMGKLAARRLIGTNTVYANIHVTKDVQHYEKVKSYLGAQFIEEISRSLKRREGSEYKGMPEMQIEILSIKSAIIHFHSPTDSFGFVNRILAKDIFYVNDISLRVIKSLLKTNDDTIMRILATIKPQKGQRKFMEAKESILQEVSNKLKNHSRYKVIDVPKVWAQIFKKNGNATNLAIGFLYKAHAQLYLDAVKAVYTNNPAKFSGLVLTIDEHIDTYYSKV